MSEHLVGLHENPPRVETEEWNLGVTFLEQSKPQRALEMFERCVEREPARAEAHSNLALAHKHLGDFEKAATSFDRAIQLGPDLAHCHYNAAGVYMRTARYQDALLAYLCAAELEAGWPQALLGAASAQVHLGDLKRGREILASVRGTDHEVAEIHRSWAHFLDSQMHFAEARDVCRDALQIESDCRDTHFMLGCLSLKLGDFERGWAEFEWRFGTGKPAKRSNRNQPVWQGEPLKGRALLLCYEQGAGDMIQFARLAPQVSNLGGRVFLEATSNLYELFRSLPGIEKIIRPKEPCEEADFQLPLPSLPRLLGFDPFQQSPQVPYLSPAAEARPDLDAFLAPYRGQYRVGVVWTGNLDQPANALRSCRPEDFSVLAGIDGVQLFSLQYEHSVPSEQLKDLGLISLQPVLGDFARTAAVVAQMDLVITVDTSMAHLAGALAHPVWTLLSEPAYDWRWFLRRDDSPWYPSMRLFWQHEPGAWEGVFQEIKGELTDLVKTSPRAIERGNPKR